MHTSKTHVKKNQNYNDVKEIDNLDNFNVKNSVLESTENTPNRDLIDKVTQTLEYLGSPCGCHYRIGGKCSVVARTYGDTDEISIFLWDGTKNRRLTYEEVKTLEELNTREEYWIRKLDTVENGYNSYYGGYSSGGDTLSNHPRLKEIKKGEDEEAKKY